MILKDAWAVFHEAWKEQRELERKKKAFTTLTRNNLNYTLIEEMFNAACKLRPGFYCKLRFPDGTDFEFGVKEKAQRIEGETF